MITKTRCARAYDLKRRFAKLKHEHFVCFSLFLSLFLFCSLSLFFSRFSRSIQTYYPFTWAQNIENKTTNKHILQMYSKQIKSKYEISTFCRQLLNVFSPLLHQYLRQHKFVAQQTTDSKNSWFRRMFDALRKYLFWLQSKCIQYALLRFAVVSSFELLILKHRAASSFRLVRESNLPKDARRNRCICLVGALKFFNNLIEPSFTFIFTVSVEVSHKKFQLRFRSINIMYIYLLHNEQSFLFYFRWKSFVSFYAHVSTKHKTHICTVHTFNDGSEYFDVYILWLCNSAFLFCNTLEFVFYITTRKVHLYGWLYKMSIFGRENCVVEFQFRVESSCTIERKLKLMKSWFLCERIENKLMYFRSVHRNSHSRCSIFLSLCVCILFLSRIGNKTKQNCTTQRFIEQVYVANANPNSSANAKPICWYQWKTSFDFSWSLVWKNDLII